MSKLVALSRVTTGNLLNLVLNFSFGLLWSVFSRTLPLHTSIRFSAKRSCFWEANFLRSRSQKTAMCKNSGTLRGRASIQKLGIMNFLVNFRNKTRYTFTGLSKYKRSWTLSWRKWDIIRKPTYNIFRVAVWPVPLLRDLPPMAKARGIRKFAVYLVFYLVLVVFYWVFSCYWVLVLAKALCRRQQKDRSASRKSAIKIWTNRWWR